MLYAQVVLPLAQPIYTFSLDEKLAVGVGDAVVVQFGSSRFYTGLVWGITTQKPDYPRLKPILRKLYSHPIIGDCRLLHVLVGRGYAPCSAVVG